MVVQNKMRGLRSPETTDAEKKARTERLAAAAAARKEDAPLATADYRAAEDATRRNMARLRAARLEREAGNKPKTTENGSKAKKSNSRKCDQAALSAPPIER